MEKYGRKDLINTGLWTYAEIDQKLERAGFSPALNFNSEHWGGADYKIMLADGRWYHVTMGYPKGDFMGTSFERRPPAWITIHCHGVDPEGLTHILDFLGVI